MKTEKKGYQLVRKQINLQKLFLKEKNYSFLAGSGISRDSPSNLPSGKRFSGDILEWIVPHTEFKSIEKLMTNENLGLYNKGYFLRFEQLIGYIRDYIDPNLDILNCYANVDSPNLNHLILAQMLIERNFQIITTNFDSLFENALLKLNIKTEDIKPLIFKENWENKLEKKGYVIYKLHGSMIHFNTMKDCRSSILVTLNQITRAKGLNFRLEDWKERKIKLILKESDLIVVGYSGLDDFDVVPTLFNIDSDMNIFWIKHKSDISPENAMVTSIETSETTTYPNLKAEDLNLFGFIFQNTRRYSNIYRIEVNTTQFLQWFSKNIELNKIPQLESNSFSSNSLESPKKPVSESLKCFLAGKIYYDQRILEKSLEQYNKVLKIIQSEENKELEMNSLIEIGLINESITPNESLNYYEQGLTIATELDNKLMMTRFQNSLGRVYFHQKDYGKALEEYDIAYKIAEKNNLIEEKADILNNKAVLILERIEIQSNEPESKIDQNEIDETINNLERAIEYSEKVGNYWGIGRTSNNLAYIYEKKGFSFYLRAVDYYNFAVEHATKLGDSRGKASALYNFGKLYKNHGFFGHAFNMFNDAYKEYYYNGTKEEQVSCLLEIAEIYICRIELKQALECYNIAKKLILQEDEEKLQRIEERINQINQYFKN